MTDNGTIHVGVVGCGQWGPNLIRNFDTLPSATLAGICDNDPRSLDRVRDLYPRVPCLASLDEMLALPHLDAVVIATPPGTHPALARQALAAGKHVLVEKPLANSEGEAREMIRAARDAQRILCVGHVFLYNRAVRYVKDFLDRGDLGDVFYMYFTRTNLGPVRDDTNAMWDLASHDISIALYWMGQTPCQVRAGGHTFLKHACIDVAFAELRFPGGQVAHCHVSWLDPCKVRRATVIGSRKMLVYSDVDPVAPITIYDKRVEPQAFTDTLAEFQMSIRDGDILIPRLTIGEPLKTQCAHFIDCIREGRQPLTDGDNGLEVVRVLSRLQESMDQGGLPLEMTP